MKTKANENLTSAQVLVNNKLYTPSVHCSYYAVFQNMKYMLSVTSNNPLSFEAQDSHSGESSHEYILSEIKKRLNVSPREERKFTDEVRFLKKERVDADYRMRMFSDIESLTCIEKANGVITKLKTYFGNI